MPSGRQWRGGKAISLLQREMGFTRAEFLQLLPAALHGYAYTQDDNHIHVTLEGKSLRITLGEEQVRRIAALALPWVPVEFDYAQLDEVAFQTFLRRFDLYYRKGGG
ncbi:MAG TPA: hypothetical protein PLE99_08015 [Candidatus Thiothrix moscowensis]|uniref:hypothetical protein n=1 Tax=unclassified Thiothrix TaxID=2636184 RepID=UPI0025CF5830|nr:MULTISPECIES: hypothetical protein [unclassified Thiothrix]HRJ52698.1 hypothetical protein [Candidatus Thiothrix moscowensis]HRJ92818.1 hypothetical protein [Candidatus Thiothrix moscowensis]